MSRIENPNLEKFIKSFVVYTLEKCDIFRKVYKKGFAQKKLEDNVKHVFSNEYSATLFGYQTPTEGSITICSNNKNEPMLNPEDLTEDYNMLSTILHESIHAILTKDKQYCKRHNIVSGSGMFEAYKFGEKGRGLNEGLTNWICKKAGYYNNTYVELTNLVSELELAIGTDRVMKLGKGDLKKNVPQLLGMSNIECRAFIEESDAIYYYNDKLLNINSWLSILKRYLNKDGRTPEEQKDIEEEFFGLQNNDKYKSNIIQMISYEIENTLENQITFLGDKTEELFKETEEVVKDAESRIFTKYFEKDLNEILRNQQITRKDFIKFRDLNSLIYKGNSLDEKDSEYSSERFQKQFEIVKKLYLNELIKNSANYYNSGKLTLEQSKSLINDATEIGKNERNHMIENISTIIAKEDAMAARKLLEYLVNKNKLEDINQYEIYYAKTKNSNIQLFMRNNKVEFTSNSVARKNIKAKEKIEEPNNIFDFTVALDEDDQSIIREFLQIKEKVEKQNPDANIEIFDRTIVIDYGYKKDLYFIENGMILPVELKDKSSVKVSFQIDRKNLLPTKYKKKNFLNELIQKIRDKVLNNPNGEVLYNDGNLDSAEKFRKSMVVYRKNDAGSQRRREKDGKIVYRKSDSDEKSR